MTPLLELKKVSFSFPERQEKAVIAATDLSVIQGESVGLSGRNGSGKSTLLKIMASLLRPTGGVVVFRGVPIQNQLAAFRRVLNYTQGAPLGFYPRLTGIENLRFFSGLKGALLASGEATLLLDKVGLPEESHSMKYSQYSLGMKQRLHLARLLLEPAELVFMDEPTNGLDVDGVRLLTQILNGPLQKKTKILVSHDEAFLSSVTQRTVSLGR